ncbi:MAG: pilus assembly protein TadG-related protein [Streptosporangiaceae bacterium]
MFRRHEPPATARPGTGHARRPDARCDRGSLTLMLAVLSVALIALAGLVIDGGAKLAEAENASAVAQEAARAGAGMISRSRAYGAGQFTVDPGQAVAAAQEYLAAAGYRGSATTVGSASIRVTVHVTEPTRVLSLIGIDTMTATATATATLEAGVTGPGS